MSKLLLVLTAALMAAPAAPAQSVFLGKEKTDWLKDLASNQPDLQRSAAFALGKLGRSDDTLAALTEALKNPSPTVRDAAAFALGEIASRFPTAVAKVRAPVIAAGDPVASSFR